MQKKYLPQEVWHLPCIRDLIQCCNRLVDLLDNKGKQTDRQWQKLSRALTY